jgi:hypothetical protein
VPFGHILNAFGETGNYSGHRDNFLPGTWFQSLFFFFFGFNLKNLLLCINLLEEERMLTMSEDTEALRSKIKEDLDILDMDELKRVYQTIAAIAAEKAIKLADRDWMEKDISREKIEEEVKRYRQSNR